MHYALLPQNQLISSLMFAYTLIGILLIMCVGMWAAYVNGKDASTKKELEDKQDAVIQASKIRGRLIDADKRDKLHDRFNG